MENSKLLLIGLMISVLVVSGCVSQTGGLVAINEITKSLPAVEEFLEKHPNSEIKTVFLDKEYISKNIGDLIVSCGDQFKIKPYYRIDMESPDLITTLWVDSESLRVECSLTKTFGSPEQEVQRPAVNPPTPTPAPSNPQ